MTASPLSNTNGILSVRLLSNGSAVDDTVQVRSVSISKRINAIPKAEIVITEGDPAAGKMPVSDSDIFAPGATITITAGYGGDEQALFTGVVVRHGIRIAADGSPQLTITCEDKSSAMTVNRRSATYRGKRDSDILGALIQGYGLNADVAETSVQQDQIAQFHCTDWDFLVARADMNGMVVLADADTIAVKMRAVDAIASLAVSYGEDLIDFTAEASANPGPAGPAHVHGEMQFQGSSLATLGCSIELKNVGRRFSGNVYVTAVTHDIADGNWLTKTEFSMPEGNLVPKREPVAQECMNSNASGLQIGTVRATNIDPAGQFMIQVSVPVLQEETDGIWARMSGFYMSAGAGAFFPPEIGDEVVLGYFDNDPSHPVVLGSLYGSRSAPREQSAANDIKAIVTRAGMTLGFDEEKKIITLVTPGGNRLSLSDDEKSVALADQNGNKLTLNANGISLDSPKDICISAQGKVKIDAVGNIELAAKADIENTALNINNHAQVAFSAKGAAAAELSASGQTTVKGAMVMIN